MMKKVLRVAAVAMCAFGLVAHADVPASKLPHIAFIDGQQVYQKYRSDIDTKLEKEFADRKDKLVAMQDDIKKATDKLSRDSAILSAAEQKKSQQALEVKQREFQRLSQAYQEDINLRGNQELQVLGDKLQTVVNSVAKEKHFDMVLQRGAAVFIDKKYDITQDVLEKMAKAKA